MNKHESSDTSHRGGAGWMTPFKVLLWPFSFIFSGFYKHFFSYITGKILRDEDRIYSIKFVWYGDSVYLHPMIWGSLILSGLEKSGVSQGWLLLAWFSLLAICFLTVMYNFDVIRSAMLLVGLIALFGIAYFSQQKYDWNPLSNIATHIRGLDATVSPGFYIVASYVFTTLIIAEVLWAWGFHRVEIDESYVYEHRFLQGTTREPIFARALKRETKDLLELLLLGAADIQHRTKNGYKRFKNVPFASLWLGTAIDNLLDYRRRGQVMLERKQRDEAEEARISDAMPEADDGWHDDDGHDDHGDDGHDDADDGDGIS